MGIKMLNCVWIISLKASIFIERKSILCSSVWCSCCCCCCCCCCFSGWGITPFQAIIAGKATALTKAEVQILKTKGWTQKSGLHSEWIIFILIVVNFLLSKATTFVNGPEDDIWYVYIKVEIQQVWNTEILVFNLNFFMKYTSIRESCDGKAWWISS